MRPAAQWGAGWFQPGLVNVAQLIGRIWIASAVLVLAGCSGADLVLPDEGAPSALTIVGGDNQAGRVGTELSAPLVVLVADASGRPVADQPVAFTVDGESGGSVSPDTAVTDVDGHAAARWLLGPGAGSQSVSVQVLGAGGLTAIFHASASAGTGARLEPVAGDAQSAVAGATLTDSLVVRAFDDDGNPASGVEVTWQTGDGGSVSPMTSTTGNDGKAATQWTLGAGAGEQSATASADGLAGSPLRFRATATVGNAGSLTIARQPSGSAESGQPFATQPQVQLRDANGNPVQQAGVAVTASISSGPSGSSLVGGATVATDGQGVATFSGLGIAGPSGTYRIGFGGAGLQSVTSGDIRISAGSASALKITRQPSSSAQSGEPLGQQPRIQLVDGSGNDVKRSGVSVTVTIASGGGTLQGDATVTTDHDGEAHFSGLAISGSAGARTLLFAAAGYSGVTSNPIQVSSSAPPPPPPPPPGTAPTAHDDHYSMLEDHTLTVGAPGVLSNDEAQTLSAVLTDGPNHGHLSLGANGGFSYQPNADYSGTDFFSYRAVSGGVQSGTATVTLSITEVNDPPGFTAGPDINVDHDAGPQRFDHWATNLTISPGNSSGAQKLTFHLTTDRPDLFRDGPDIDSDGTLTFRPDGERGTATVTVILQDDGGTANGGDDTSDPQTFTITFH